jgi:hypothetical protein
LALALLNQQVIIVIFRIDEKDKNLMVKENQDYIRKKKRNLKTQN